MEKVRLGSNIIAMSTPPPKRNSMQTLRAPSGHLQGNHRHKSMSLSSSQSPVNAISIRNFCPQLEAASVLGSTGDNRKDATTEGGMRFNLFRTGGTFAIVRFDFDIRDERPLRPSPNSRVAHSNGYEKRFRYPSPADGPLPRPEKCSRRTRDARSLAEALLYRPEWSDGCVRIFSPLTRSEQRHWADWVRTGDRTRV